jgi:hypothetical protein
VWTGCGSYLTSPTPLSSTKYSIMLPGRLRHCPRQIYTRTNPHQHRHA